ncbi:MAG: efflux RND transporter periplasmic adaptor subunit [Bacteroidota bacterium]|nr:efflux RND transporter periplasmic adaptor subunit [Bacteroidota bacterium]
MRKFSLYFLVFGVMAAACNPKTQQEKEEEPTASITPVTITSATMDTMAEYIDLNATSAYLLKAVVKASANGYIQSVNAVPGKMVSAGQNVFTVKTKEAQSIGNTINSLDTSFKFSGVINVRAGTSGYVSEVDHQAGDYVQEGEQLAVINDVNSFVFMLNLPYELRNYVLDKKKVELLLPDGKLMTGIISSIMPVVDSVSQTQNIAIKVNEKNLPVNLVAKVRVIKKAKANTISLPKQSILSDETQTNFWVMKLIDSATAIKVPVTKGIETNDRVEILSPGFTPADKFLLTGNYGLSDTAKIKIVQQ